MIREWLATWRRHRAARRGERAWFRDRRRHPDERIALRDAQIAGLRGQVSTLAAENAQLKVAVAAAVMSTGLEYYRQQGRETTRRLAEEPTAVVSADQFRRTRPAGPAPATEPIRRQW
jgi:hypothetical protein